MQNTESPARFLPDAFEELPDVLQDDQRRSKTYDEDCDEDEKDSDDDDDQNYVGKQDRAGRRILQPACTSPTSKPGHNDDDDDDDNDYHAGVNDNCINNRGFAA